MFWMMRLTVIIVICIIAPLTQSGLNPAQDLLPRLFSYLAGWGRAASPDNNFGLVVYGLAPILSGASSFSKKKLQYLHPNRITTQITN